MEERGAIVERSERLIEELAGSPRTRIGVGPLIPWGSSARSFRDAVELSERRGARIHLHTAETPEYNHLVRERTGLDNVEMLAEVGALGDAVMLNHCVHLSERDIALIADSGTHVIHDPTSNMILASGVAPVPELLRAGVNVGLACDGPACNNGQDMIEAMKDAALLHKVVTRAARRADRPRRVPDGDRAAGRARSGWRAGSACCVPGRSPTSCSSTAPRRTSRRSATRSRRSSTRRAGPTCETVLVGGEVVVADGAVTTLDEAEVRVRAGERAARAAALAGV